MKKIVTALVLGGTMAAGAVLAPAAQAAPAAPQTNARPHQTGYVQRGDTVTVYRDGAVAAEVTVESVTRKRGKARLDVTVEAQRNFSLTAGEFLYEAEDGGDYDNLDPQRKLKVKAHHSETFTLTYGQATDDGEVIWLPADGEEYLAGAWTVEDGDVESDARVADFGYVQRRDTVTVYKSGKVVAKVTPLVTEVNERNEGVLKLTVKAVRTFRLNPNWIIWESADGEDNKPVNGTRSVTVRAKTTQEIDVRYQNVDSQNFFWSPGDKTLAGFWNFD